MIDIFLPELHWDLMLIELQYKNTISHYTKTILENVLSSVFG